MANSRSEDNFGRQIDDLVKKQYGSFNLPEKDARRFSKILAHLGKERFYEERSVEDRQDNIDLINSYLEANGLADQFNANKIYEDVITLAETNRLQKKYPGLKTEDVRKGIVSGIKKNLSPPELRQDLQQHARSPLQAKKDQYLLEKDSAPALEKKADYQMAYQQFLAFDKLKQNNKLPVRDEPAYDDSIDRLEALYQKMHQENFYPPYVNQEELQSWLNAKLRGINQLTDDTAKKTQTQKIADLADDFFLERLIFNRDSDRPRASIDDKAGALFVKNLFNSGPVLQQPELEEDEEQKNAPKESLNYHFGPLKQKAYIFLSKNEKGSAAYKEALEGLRGKAQIFDAALNSKIKELNELIEEKTKASKLSKENPIIYDNVLLPDVNKFNSLLMSMQSILLFSDPLLPNWPVFSRENLIKMFVYFPTHMYSIINMAGENSALMRALLGQGNLANLTDDIQKEIDLLQSRHVEMPATVKVLNNLKSKAPDLKPLDIATPVSVERKSIDEREKKHPNDHLFYLRNDVSRALTAKAKTLGPGKESFLLAVVDRLQSAKSYESLLDLIKEFKYATSPPVPMSEVRQMVYEHANKTANTYFNALLKDMKGASQNTASVRAGFIEYLRALKELWEITPIIAKRNSITQAEKTEIDFLQRAIHELVSRGKPTAQIIAYVVENLEAVKSSKSTAIEQLKAINSSITALPKVEAAPPPVTATVASAEAVPPIAPAVANGPSIVASASSSSPPATTTVTPPATAAVPPPPKPQAMPVQPPSTPSPPPKVKTTPVPPAPSAPIVTTPLPTPTPQPPPLPKMGRPVKETAAKRQAAKLLKTINDDHLADINDPQSPIIANKKSYEEQFNQFKLPETHLDDYLAGLRNAELSTKSHVINLEGTAVRVYPRKPKNIDVSGHDLFAAGLDNSRATLTILTYSKMSPDQHKKADGFLRQALTQYHKKVKEILDGGGSALKKLKAIQKLNKKLNRHLAQCLVGAGVYANKKMALKGIQKARDYNWQLDRREAVCTVRGKTGAAKVLSFAKHLEFDDKGLQDYAHQSWFKTAAAEHPWMKSFYENEKNQDLLKLSPPPMTRTGPNPANAWRESLIVFDDQSNTIQIHSGTRIGNSSPYGLAEEKERQRLTERNQLLMASDDWLKDHVTKHANTWQGLMPAPPGPLKIPILHQTLIDPGSPRYYGRSNSPEVMIKDKRKANQALREHLATKQVYLNNKTGEVHILARDAAKPAGPDLMPVQFELKETNNGVNIAERLTLEFREDVQHAEDLITNVVDKLNLMKTESVDLDLVKAFLARENVDLSPRLSMSKQEKEALRSLSAKLFDGTFDLSVPLETQRNLALLVQSACKLKSQVHQSYAGRLRSNLNRRFDENDLSKTGRVLTGAGRPLGRLLEKKDATKKSCYERIVAELLGERMGGCKSAIDREGEIAELTTGLYLQFAERGTIDHFFRRENYTEYANTQHKHNMAEMITGTAGTSDTETQGLLYRREGRDERDASDIAHSSRKVKASKLKFYEKEEKFDSASSAVKPEEQKQPEVELGPVPVRKETVDLSSAQPMDVSRPLSPSVEQKAPSAMMMSSQLMSNKLHVQAELKKVATVVPPPKEAGPSSDKTYYKVTEGDSLFAVKKEGNDISLYALQIPKDEKELLALAFSQIAAFVDNKGIKATIYINDPSLDPKLIEAYHAIAEANGLKIHPPAEVHQEIPDKYKKLNISFLREQNKTKLSVLSPWRDTASGHLTFADAELAKDKPVLQTLKSMLFRLQEDKSLIDRVVTGFPEHVRFLAEIEVGNHSQRIDATIKAIEARITQMETVTVSSGPASTPNQDNSKRLSH